MDDQRLLKPGQAVTVRLTGKRAWNTRNLPEVLLAPEDLVRVLGATYVEPAPVPEPEPTPEPTPEPEPVPVLLPAPADLRFVTEGSEIGVRFTPVPGASTHHTREYNAAGTVTGGDVSATSGSGPWATSTVPARIEVWAVDAAGVRISETAAVTYAAPPVVEPPTTEPAPPTGGVLYERATWPNPFAVGGDIQGVHGTVVSQNGGEFIRSNWTTGGPWAGAETHGVDLSPPNARTVRPREVWLDTAVREIGDGWGRTSDDKTLFIIPDYSLAGGEGEQSRWAIYLRGSNGSWYGGPYPENGVPDYLNFQASPRRLYDGQKHRIRVHCKMATNETATDGIYRVWIDDELCANYVGIRTGNPAAAFFRVIALGRNVDPGPGCSRDWYGVTLHTANPGW